MGQEAQHTREGRTEIGGEKWVEEGGDREKTKVTPHNRTQMQMPSAILSGSQSPRYCSTCSLESTLFKGQSN